MGWFSDFCSDVASGVASVASSAARAVSSVASSAWNTAKSVASKTVGWLADKAENFIGVVKDTWTLVKPFIEKITPWIDSAADLIPWPWLRIVVKTVAKGLQGLLMLENSPVLKKIESALEWAIKTARKLRDTFLTETEEEEAIRRQQDLDAAMSAMETEEQRQSIRFAAIINDYILIQTRIQKILERDNVDNFEHYLRLRATQKLLREAERTLQTAETMEEITPDDLFLMKAGQKLIATNPELTDAEMDQLNEVIGRRFSGKTLLPFVFEELIRAWETKRQNMEAKWDKLNNECAALGSKVDYLEVKMKTEQLNSEELTDLINLKNDLASINHKRSVQAEDNRAMKSYVDAAEGFLQFLEKPSFEQLEAEGLDFILDDVADIGILIIDCAQNNKQWKELTEEQKDLIIGYANIFAGASKKRHAELQSIEVA